MDITSGYTETIQGHQVEIISQAPFRRGGTTKWSYVVDGHADTIPTASWATPERAIEAARTRLAPGARCGTCGSPRDTWGICTACGD